MNNFEKPTIYNSHESGKQTNNTDDIPYAVKKVPWDNKMTPQTDGLWSDEIDRRMRAAVRLLEHALQHCGGSFTAQNMERHLEAARKEDA